MAPTLYLAKFLAKLTTKSSMPKVGEDYTKCVKQSENSSYSISGGNYYEQHIDRFVRSYDSSTFSSNNENIGGYFNGVPIILELLDFNGNPSRQVRFLDGDYLHINEKEFNILKEQIEEVCRGSSVTFK